MKSNESSRFSSEPKAKAEPEAATGGKGAVRPRNTQPKDGKASVSPETEEFRAPVKSKPLNSGPRSMGNGSRWWLALYAKAADRARYELRRSLPLLLLWCSALGLVQLAGWTGANSRLQDLLWDRYAARQELRQGTNGALPSLAVEIDGEDLRRFGPLPWRPEVLEDVLLRLEETRARALVLAVPGSRLLTFPPNLQGPMGMTSADSGVTERWINRGNLILPRGLLVGDKAIPELEPGILGPHQEALDGPVAVMEPDDDGRMRRLSLSVKTDVGQRLTMAGAMAERLNPSFSIEKSLRLYIPGREFAIPRVNLTQLMEGRIPPHQLEGTVLILGPAVSYDRGQRAPEGVQSRRMSEAEILALAAWQLQRGPWPVPIPSSTPILMLTALLIGGWMMRQYMTRLLLGCLVGVMAIVLADYALFIRGWMLPSAELLTTLLSLTGLLMLTWMARIRALMQGFETHLWQAGQLRCAEKDAQEALLERVYRLINPVRPMHSLVLAVPERETRWLKIVAGIGAREQDILERRRDFGRDPYLTALTVVESPEVRGYMRDKSLRTYMIPLRYMEQLQGFFIVNLTEEQSTETLRWLRALAPEVASRLRVLQLDARKRDSFQQGAYEEAMDQLEASTRHLFDERERLEALMEHMTPGILQADRLGQVRMVNRSLQYILRELGLQDVDMGLAPLLSHLSGMSIEQVGKQLERLLFGGEPFAFTLVQKEKGLRLYRAELTGLWFRAVREPGAIRLPDGWCLTVMDVSELHAHDRLELMHTRLQDHLTVLQGYCGLFEMAHDPSEWDPAWIEAMLSRAKELVRFVRQWSVQDQVAAVGGRSGEPTDLVSLLEEVVKDLNREHPGQISLRAPAVGVSPVLIDREQGRRGLKNLLSDLLEGDERPDGVTLRVEEGELAHQRVFIDNALSGLPAVAVARLFDPVQPGEHDSPNAQSRLLMARRLLKDAGGVLREDPEILARGTMAIEFPKV